MPLDSSTNGDRRSWARGPFVVGALLGVLVGVSLYGAYWLFGHTLGPLELVLWPSGVILQAFDGASTPQVVSAVLVTVLVNGLMYGTVAWLGALILRQAHR